MPELQTFLQKKKDQNTAQEDQRRKQKARRTKTAMFSMAAAGVIPLFAPPLGTDSSVFALAAVAESISGLEEEQTAYDALIAAMIAENEEAKKAQAVFGGNETYKEAARRALQEWKETAGSILGEAFPEWEDSLHLLELNEEDALFEEDKVAEKEGKISGFDNSSQTLDSDGASGQTAGSSSDLEQTGSYAKASIAIGGMGTKATVATGENGTKATVATGKTGTKASIAIGGAGVKVAAASEGAGIKALAEGAATASKTPAAETAEKASAKVDESVKTKPETEQAFFKGIDMDSIPSALALQYNVGYATLKLSDEQLTVLERIVEAEAGDEDAYGKILVANVVLNRVLDKEFPDTVKEVVFQNNGKTYQFSPVRKGGRYYTVKVSKHTKAAVARALKGEDYSSGALYFFARRYTSQNKANWFDTSLKKIVEYGCHEFFGNK